MEPYRQAERLGHPWTGSDHALLALLARPSAASEILEGLGVTYDRLDELVTKSHEEHVKKYFEKHPDQKGTRPTPDFYGVQGRAVAFAAVDGEARPRPEHWLLALVWDDGSAASTLHVFGVSQAEILDRLRLHGVRVPPIDPPLFVPMRGERCIEIDPDEMEPMFQLLKERHPPGSEWRWGYNWTGEPDDSERRGLVMAEEGIDLDALLQEVRSRA
jgi:hypothetical protein